MIRRIAASVLILGALAFGACGGDDSTSSSTSAPTLDPGQAMKVDAIPDAAPSIDQNNLTFKPATLTATKGQAIFFKDSDQDIYCDMGLGSGDSALNSTRESRFGRDKCTVTVMLVFP